MLCFVYAYVLDFKHVLRNPTWLRLNESLDYLFGTQNLGLWYPKKSSLELIGFSDADYAGSKTDRKSISKTCQFFGHMLVSWSSKK